MTKILTVLIPGNTVKPALNGPPDRWGTPECLFPATKHGCNGNFSFTFQAI